MASYFDDNFGAYEPSDDPEANYEFYKRTQAESVWKKCKGCGRRVKIKADYAYCNSCCVRMERGEDIGG